VGGYINAYTSREATAYYVRVLEDDVALGLDVIADILLNPLFRDDDVEVERGVILQEIGMTNDTPDDIVFDWLQEQAFPDQAIGRTILGPSERVSAFSQDDLRTFVGEHYGPNQMILAAAGSVDHDKIVAQAEALFGGLAALERRSDIIQPARFVGGETRRNKDLEQVHFALALEGPDYRDGLPRPENLHLTDLFICHGRRRVLAAVPRGARKERAVLLNLRANRRL